MNINLFTGSEADAVILSFLWRRKLKHREDNLPWSLSCVWWSRVLNPDGPALEYVAWSITSSFICYFMQIQTNIKMLHFPLVFSQKVAYCSHCSALWFWSILNTTYCGNHPTSGQRASSFFLCSTMWFWLKTQPFMVQPGSGDRTGSLYLSCWSLGEWGANWINVCLPARSFNWGMVLRFKSGKEAGEKREENLSAWKHFQMVLDVTHKRNT